MDRHPSAFLAEKTGRRASVAREEVRFLLIGWVDFDGLVVVFDRLVEVEFGLLEFICLRLFGGRCFGDLREIIGGFFRLDLACCFGLVTFSVGMMHSPM